MKLQIISFGLACFSLGFSMAAALMPQDPQTQDAFFQAKQGENNTT